MQIHNFGYLIYFDSQLYEGGLVSEVIFMK